MRLRTWAIRPGDKASRLVSVRRLRVNTPAMHACLDVSSLPMSDQAGAEPCMKIHSWSWRVAAGTPPSTKSGDNRALLYSWKVHRHFHCMHWQQAEGQVTEHGAAIQLNSEARQLRSWPRCGSSFSSCEVEVCSAEQQFDHAR
jgi:hypothetical protein